MKRRDRQQSRDVRGQLPLGDARCAEPRARGNVHRQIDVELALFAVFLDVRSVHARGDVPIDAPHVVAGLVLADLLEIEPGPAKDTAVGAHESLVGEDARLDLHLLHDAEDLGRNGLPLRSGMERGGHR